MSGVLAVILALAGWYLYPAILLSLRPSDEDVNAYVGLLSRPGYGPRMFLEAVDRQSDLSKQGVLISYAFGINRFAWRKGSRVLCGVQSTKVSPDLLLLVQIVDGKHPTISDDAAIAHFRWAAPRCFFWDRGRLPDDAQPEDAILNAYWNWLRSFRPEVREKMLFSLEPEDFTGLAQNASPATGGRNALYRMPGPTSTMIGVETCTMLAESSDPKSLWTAWGSKRPLSVAFQCVTARLLSAGVIDTTGVDGLHRYSEELRALRGAEEGMARLLRDGRWNNARLKDACVHFETTLLSDRP
ncbi:MAG TPA: hypothetical protein PK280_07190 [Planctomycetota bacterium]|nr:hypothetical protein [Planctomycetota bacterium]